MARLTAEQEKVVLHDSGNILVTASAGSGKTHTMIERVIRLVTEQKATVKEILAVTFTEMAALEMKEKLKSALIKKIAKDGNRVLIEQVNEVSTADISTLHSFCGKLIRTYFFKVGLSPDFKICDQSQADIIKSEAIDLAFKHFYDSGEEWFINLVDRFAQSRADSSLKKLVLSAHEFASSEADPEVLLNKHLTNYTVDGYEKIKARYKQYLNKQLISIKNDAVSAQIFFKTEGLKKATALADSMIQTLDALISAPDLSILKMVNGFKVTMNFDSNLTPIQLEYKELLNSCKARLNKKLDKFAETYFNDLADEKTLQENLTNTDNFVKLIRKFSEIYTALKREENLLDFNDLEHFALNILYDEQLAKDIRSKYKFIFVDECQDTNGVQDKIISSISNDNLFMVGDIKQSIYGFRGCRPEIFSAKTKKMQDEGQAVVRLNDNFRSAKTVIKSVNDIFDFCMTEEFFGEEYSKTSRLKFGGGYPEGADGRTDFTYLHVADKNKIEETPRIYDVLEDNIEDADEDACSVATLVTELINQELTKTYYDVKEGKEKQVTYGDIVILTRNKKTDYVQGLVKGLKRHDIPVASEVKENVCDFPEIAMLVNALKLVDCFNQDIPLASTLRGPIGSFSDEDLFEIATYFRDSESANSKELGFVDAFNYYINNADTPLKQRLVEFKEYIDKLRFLADFIGAKGVLQKLVLDKNLEGCFYAQRGGKLKVQRLNRFISASADGGKLLSVKEFISKAQDDENNAEAFGFTDGVEEDTVRVMTIHASKGLEFPVVIVCGLEKVLSAKDETQSILFSREFGFALKSFDDKERTSKTTILRGLIKEIMADERVREEMRLFYVATTRATYSLRLACCGKKESRRDVFTGADKFIDFIPKNFPMTTIEEENLRFNNLTKDTRTVIIASADEQVVERMKKDFSFRYPFILDTALPLKTTVTKANKQAYDEEQEKPIVLFEEHSTDIERGITAHKILELLDFNFDKPFDAQVLEMIERGEVLKEQVDRLDLERIKKALADDVFKGLKDSKLYREKSFLVQVPASKVIPTATEEGVLLQGIIDLLCIDADGARVIDYKYSSLKSDALKEKYQKQLDLYAFAVEKVLKIKVKEKRLVNLFTGETVKMP